MKKKDDLPLGDDVILKEKMAALGTLLAGIAHEIKNPLNFIYGNVNFLERYLNSIEEYIHFLESFVGDKKNVLKKRKELNIDYILGDFKEILHEVNEGAERIKNLVDDLKIFSRKPSEKKVRVDVHRVIDMALNLLRNRYKRRIEIERNYCKNGEIEVMLGKIEQVFLNVLSNSIDAIEGKGKIVIRTRRGRKNFFVEISDNGCGISEGDLKKIFDPFFSTKEVGEGLGLGLSISYNIVKSHGGDIKVESKKDKGTTFKIILPIGDIA